MPYIKQSERPKFKNALDNLVKELLEDPDSMAGNFNYCVTIILKRLIEKNKRYKTMNDLIGALECAKLELYRRVVGPYEDEKIGTNGDVS